MMLISPMGAAACVCVHAWRRLRTRRPPRRCSRAVIYGRPPTALPVASLWPIISRHVVHTHHPPHLSAAPALDTHHTTNASTPLQSSPSRPSGLPLPPLRPSSLLPSPSPLPRAPIMADFGELVLVLGDMHIPQRKDQLPEQFKDLLVSRQPCHALSVPCPAPPLGVSATVSSPNPLSIPSSPPPLTLCTSPFSSPSRLSRLLLGARQDAARVVHRQRVFEDE